jgi:hypothetical protein
MMRTPDQKQAMAKDQQYLQMQPVPLTFPGEVLMPMSRQR